MDLARIMDRLALLKELSFGSQVAEEEIQHLASYFVETDQWNRIVKGDIGLVRGEKGAGKSAIYLLLGENADSLFDRGVLLVNAENPRGATVFKDLVSDPPTSEAEFVVLWKMYLLSIICFQLRSFGINGDSIRHVYSSLEGAGLLERELNLSSLLRSAQAFARRLLRISSLEGGLQFDPNTGVPTGVSGKISLTEPSGDLRAKGINSVDGLFLKVNEELSKASLVIWALLDRLDIAFAESHELEANAIRALIKVYSDLRGQDQIKLKIFLREDIWRRITASGLREASHLVRYQIVEWNAPTLLHLMMRRMLSNDVIVKQYDVDREAALSSAAEQERLFNRIFPPQVEQGPQKAPTFKWMVTRCADGKDNTAPRELIHLLNSIREQEIRRLERGGGYPAGEQLFDRSVFKAALPTVSAARLQTYMYAEYPAERPFLEKLDGQKTEQTPDSLSELWGVPRAEAIAKAAELVDLGFFQARGTRSEPTYWVPFLYRDALHLVQGRAESDPE
ncbi:P-loop ATPase, Sll1717 family [Hansschlegelia sp.]|uniref:P-loop ATPase, Sll1717 family n=1 Tax=Hansschlegelia sp. TaxID=2041892 RepID=UPI002C6EDDB3|nr:hypothetical protein [Hansschlegelia sp.]HVI28857.1 hypothetical protein [Hansschlegelia sp.]